MSSLLPEYESCIGLIRQSGEIGVEIQTGARRYLGNRRCRWRRADASDELAGLLGKGDVDCMIAAVGDRATADLLVASGLPVVNTSGLVPQSGLLRVGIDDEAVGRLAGKHLTEAGFRRLLFVGIAGHGYSEARKRGFLAVVAEVSGAEAEVADVSTGDWDRSLERVGGVVASAPGPLGVFACRDPMAANVCDLAESAGRNVPADVAVLGADNIRTTCEFHNPTLSSIALPWEQVGFRAIELLDGMMHGEPPPAGPVLLEPIGVVQRESSDVLALNDPVVRDALRLIESGAASGLSVAELAEQLGVTRWLLLERFREHLGRSPGEQIRLVRLQLAQDMLSRSDAPLARVALDCGFCSQSHFTKAFHKHTDQTPAAYRKTHRARFGT